MNKLFPVFLKLEQLSVLLVGAGPIGLEKISALLRNSPEAKVNVVAEEVSDSFRVYIAEKPFVKLYQRSFQEADLEDVDLVILASNNPAFNERVRRLTKQRNILLNVADKPDLCDFYLGSVVTKGNLKIGISTNGKSPTIAKRLKELLNDLLPEEIDETLVLMHEMREQLKGDIQDKIKILNAHTRELVK